MYLQSELIPELNLAVTADSIHRSDIDYAIEHCVFVSLNTFSTDKIELYHFTCHHFSDISECIIFVKNQTKKAVLLVAHTDDDSILRLHELPQIYFIYLYLCSDRLVSTYYPKKIRGNFTVSDKLETLVTEDLDLYAKQLLYIMSISIVSDHLNTEHIQFVYFQLVIDIILDMPQTDAAKEETISEYRLHYKEHRQIHSTDFYETHTAIDWYMQNNSVYRIINEAFHTEDTNTLFNFRYFINDLHNEIRKSHTRFVATLPVEQDHLMVYRGQLMTINDLQKLKANIDGFISINSFLITTRLLNTARTYAGDSSNQLLYNVVSVIFEIDIDMCNNVKKPFANLNSNDKNEIIFSIGAVFKIHSVTLLTDNLWSVRLSYGKNADMELDASIEEHYMNIMGESVHKLTFGTYLSILDEFDKAQQYHKLLLSTTNDNK
ncbi:unnamed protein product, partial [Didymodactylos carnosus]